MITSEVTGRFVSSFMKCVVTTVSLSRLVIPSSSRALATLSMLHMYPKALPNEDISWKKKIHQSSFNDSVRIFDGVLKLTNEVSLVISLIVFWNLNSTRLLSAMM